MSGSPFVSFPITSPINPARPRTLTRFAATTAGPGTSGIVCNSGIGAYTTGDIEKGSRDINKLPSPTVELLNTQNPSLELAHVARMRAYYHLGLFDLAREEGQRSLQVNPSPSVEYLRLDVALDLFDGQYEGAVDKARPLARRCSPPGPAGWRPQCPADDDKPSRSLVAATGSHGGMHGRGAGPTGSHCRSDRVAVARNLSRR